MIVYALGLNIVTARKLCQNVSKIAPNKNMCPYSGNDFLKQELDKNSPIHNMFMWVYTHI